MLLTFGCREAEAMLVWRRQRGRGGDTGGSRVGQRGGGGEAVVKWFGRTGKGGRVEGPRRVVVGSGGALRPGGVGRGWPGEMKIGRALV